ncbi:Prolyl oligopeptidase family protein [Mucisphaera calidilacus]|uniref:Prolyl oligopeptidase family protein n=2 Tax=Mucisphaera calidilacus TaxID=2527982 RepID=A0A518BVS8_9BACT|nr:Prolyl oligopeptidase family protein [Mucisphaera calidilacus]
MSDPNNSVPILPLLDHGFAIARIEYRLTTESDLFNSVRFPAQIHDVKGAVRFLRANAENYNIDPERFAAVGSSAGGHLAALLGVSANHPQLEGNTGGNLNQPSNVQAVVDLFGPSNLLTMGGWHDQPDSPESRLIDWDLGDLKHNLENPNPPYPLIATITRDASPVYHVDPTDPPFFIAHGTADTTVPYTQSTELNDALVAANVPVDFHTVNDDRHTIMDMPLEAVFDFITTTLAPQALPIPADANLDGKVDLLDLSILASNFGVTGSIPEPASATLISLGLLATRRRRSA